MLRYGHGGFHHPVFTALFLALLAALVVLGAIAVVRLWRNPPGRPAPFLRGTPQIPAIDPALSELRVRYARGDINWDEYAQRARNLGYPLSPPTSPGSDPNGPPPEAQAPPDGGS
jgi:uncharacterized membrane protein